ncbi:MAG: lipid-A-disaccharide synthase N-terminal domain-containing protein [Planctomycetota bacterium]
MAEPMNSDQAAEVKAKRKRVKWEPAAAMLGVVLIGVWLVTFLGVDRNLPELREGAVAVQVHISGAKGALEALVPEEGGPVTYRFLYRDGSATEVLTREQVTMMLPVERLDELHGTVLERGAFTRGVFRVFNISGWASLLWVAIGLGGQAAFFGRMAIQWVLSEKERKSVVPEAFWWLSLGGGVALFTYFVWRQDVVGVLGQSTGVVIYARNLRLIHKQRRRDAREAQEVGRAAGPEKGSAAAGMR